MHSTAKPKQADDPHDLVEVTSGVARVAPADPRRAPDEEVSSLLRAAARQRSDAQSRQKSDNKSDKQSDVTVSPSAPAVDTTFRPAAVNNGPVKTDRSSTGRRTILRGVIGFALALSIIVGAAAWQLYGDAAIQTVAGWVPQFARAPSPSPQDSTLAVQPSPASVQAPEVTPAAGQSAESAPQGVGPAAAPVAGAPTLQSMVRDVATLGQKVEQLQATIEQLKASQDQMSRDLAKASEAKALEGRASDAKGLEAKSSEAKASEQNLRPRTPPSAPRPAVVPPRKPIAAFRQPQVTATPVAPPPPAPYGQRQPEPLPPATPQLSDPEFSAVPRPPLPLHQ